MKKTNEISRHFSDAVVELKVLSTAIPTMLKLAFVGKDFEKVTHTCSEEDYKAIKKRVEKSRFKSHQLLGDVEEHPYESRYLRFELGMDMHEVTARAHERIKNKLRLAFRVIWFSVLPVPQNEVG